MFLPINLNILVKQSINVVDADCRYYE